MNEFWVFYGFGVIARVAIGFVCGLIPLIYGLEKDQKNRAVMGFSTCIIAGFFCGLLLAPLVAIFYVWRIYKNPKGEPEDDEETGLTGLNLNAPGIDEKERR